MRAILSSLKLEKVKFEFYLSTDLKLQNIIAGMQANSSMHPCVYCIAPRPFEKEGELRTLGGNRELSSKFRADGANKKDAKDYLNVIGDPLIDGSDETEFIEIFPIPELHELIGIGELIFLMQKIEIMISKKKSFS